MLLYDHIDFIGIILHSTFYATACCSRQEFHFTWFQGSAAVEFKSGFLWDCRHHKMVVSYWRSEANYQFFSSRVEGSKKNFSWADRPLEVWPTGCTETFRCVKSHKIADFRSTTFSSIIFNLGFTMFYTNPVHFCSPWRWLIKVETRCIYCA
jgi:hypothetical protein